MTDSGSLQSALRAWSDVFMRRSVHEFLRAMKDAGLSPSQLSTLMRLHYHGACPISEVGDDLGVTTAAASQMVERLVQQGLIERSEDPDDRRVRRIGLTPHGKALIGRGVEARLAWMKGLQGKLGIKEQAQASRLLRRLTQAARDLESAPRHEARNPS